MTLWLRCAWDRPPDLDQGLVWSARDRILGARVTVKMIRLAPQEGSTELARLQTEAEILACLEHPGVPELLDAGISDTPGSAEERVAYLVLNHVPGSDPVRAARSLDPPGRDRMIASALTVLADLHRLGILHGDLSPGNVVVRENGLASLLDFGLAQTRAEAAAVPDLRGTPGYLAPERARGEGGDHRSDLYSLGVVLAEALEAVGVPVPDPIQAMMQPVPADRPSTAEEVLSALGLERAYPVSAGLARPALIGRQEPLEAMLEQIHEPRPGRQLFLVRCPRDAGLGRFLHALSHRLGWKGLDRLRIQMDGRPGLQGLQETLAAALEASDPGESLLALLRRFLARRRQAGRQRPLWLLLDAGGSPDRVLLDALGDLTRNLPLGLVIGERRTEPIQVPLVPQATILELDDLEPAGTRELVGSMMGGTTAPPGLADLIHTSSSGRPGSIVRILRRLTSHGLLRPAERGFVLAGKDPEALTRKIHEAGLADAPVLEHPEAHILAVAVGLCAGFLHHEALPGAVAAPAETLSSALEELLGIGLLELRTGSRGWGVGVRDRANLEALKQRLSEPDLRDLASRLLPIREKRGGRPLDLLELSILAAAPGRAVAWVPAAVEQALEESAPGRAELLLTRLLALLDDPREEAQVLEGLLRIHLRFHQPEKTLEVSRRLLAVAREPLLRQTALLAQADANLAVRALAETESALERLDEEAPLTPASRVRRSVLQADLEVAREEPARGLDALLAAEPDLASCDPGHRYLGLAAMGRLYQSLGRGEQGRPYLERALEVARESGAHRDAADTSVNLGILDKDAGDLERAEDRYHQAARIYRDRGYTERLAQCLTNLGRLALKRGNPRQAVDRLEEARDAAPESMEPLFHARVLLSLGEAYEASGVTDRAEEAYQRVRDLTHDADLTIHEALVLQKLGALQQQEGRNREALESRVRGLRLLSGQAPSPLVEQTAGELAEEILQIPGEEISGQGRLEAFIQIRRVVEQEAHPERLLDEILRLAVRWTRAERCLILGIAPQSGDQLTIQRLYGVEAEEATDLESFSQSVAREVLRTGRPLITNDALADPHLSRFKSVQHQQLRSILCIPLGSKGKEIGVLYVDHRRRDSMFSQGRMVELLQEFAYLAATVIEHARERESLSSQLVMAPAFAYLSGLKSQAMHRIIGEAMKVSQTDCTVLLLGETGTGKGRLAQAIHQASARQAGPFMAINVAAVPDNLLESELFGVTKGAHSTADQDRPGLYKAAHTGSLFLDEIAEPSPSIQVKLLQVLETGRIRPVGSVVEEEVDVRLLAATNRDPEEAVAEGRLRADLFHRLNVFPIRIPPLRERVEDIPELARHFLRVFRSRHHRPGLIGFAPAAMAMLQTRPFPGNVRELENLIERATILAEGATWIDRHHLETEAHQDGPDLGMGLNEILSRGRDRLQKQLVESYLRKTQGNIARASELAGVQRPNFYRLMRRHGIRREDFLPQESA